MSKVDLVAAGHICLDITPEIPDTGRSLEHLFRPGSLTVIGPPAMSTGGAVANVGLCAQRMGLNVALMGKCGDDLLGEALLAVLKQNSVTRTSQGMRIVPGEKTSYSIVVAAPGADRIFLHCPGANDTFAAADVDLDIVAASRLFYFGYPPLMARMYRDGGGELAGLLAGVKSRGVTTALDMAMPDPAGESGRADWPGIVAKALPHVDIFLPSFEEILMMLRRRQYDRMAAKGDLLAQAGVALVRELADECLAMGPAVVMVKCGRHGLYVKSGPAAAFGKMGSVKPAAKGWAGKEVFAPAYHVPKVASATGSGDAAVAGFLAALLRGADLTTAADYACASGAQNVQAVDASSGIKSWAETTTELNNPRVAIPEQLRL
jgi:sugar/nucleoside kinase (ribokinase family)